MNNKVVRLIPIIDVKGPNLVKGIQLEGLRVLGKPEDFALHYYNNSADELIFIDVVASLYERNSLSEIISKTAKEIFIPINVGGGIRSLADIRSVLRLGADKVSLNTAVIKNPNFIKEAAIEFGSSTICVSIESIKHPDNKYYAYTDNGREFSGKEVIEWAKEAESLGAGELLVCSVDREGTRSGFDIEIFKNINQNISIPLIANGGAGKLQDFSDLIIEADVDAIAFSSIIHYDFVKKNKTDSASKLEGNIEYLKSKNDNINNNLKTFTIQEIKEYLNEKGIKCR